MYIYNALMMTSAFTPLKKKHTMIFKNQSKVQETVQRTDTVQQLSIPNLLALQVAHHRAEAFSANRKYSYLHMYQKLISNIWKSLRILISAALQEQRVTSLFPPLYSFYLPSGNDFCTKSVYRSAPILITSNMRKA